jgi:glutamate formiminotransferase
MCQVVDVLVCVVNISEGRRGDLLSALAAAAGECLLDVHSDCDHNRSVLTLAGPAGALSDAVRALAAATVARLDLSRHDGAHPRLGVLDVVPWVPFAGWPLVPGRLATAVTARDEFAAWAGPALSLPCFLYGPERTLPELRRQAWASLAPATGPVAPHPSAGATAVGARPALVAYNLWLAEPDLEVARAIAAGMRGPAVRALGLVVGDHVQVSCNLIEPARFGPEAAFDAVASRAGVARAELVGLLPASVLAAVPAHRWPELDLDQSRTIEARLEQAGLDGGSRT